MFFLLLLLLLFNVKWYAIVQQIYDFRFSFIGILLFNNDVVYYETNFTLLLLHVNICEQI